MFAVIPETVKARSVKTVLSTGESNNRAAVMIGFGLRLKPLLITV